MAYAKKINGVNIYNIAKRNGIPMRNIAKYGTLLNINAGLVGWWKFDENTGTSAYDSSGNGNTGTLTNGPTWTTGKINSALSFDGFDDYVTIGNASVFNNFADMTISVWIYLNGWGTWDPSVICRKDWIYELHVMRDNKCLEFLTGDNWGGGALRTANNSLTLGAWHHVVAVKDTATAKKYLYINGSLSASGGSGYAPTGSNTAPVEISGPSGRAFDGKIDDVRVYNRVLSADDVTALYNVTA